MKNDMINIYKWLSKFINIHLTTQEAQELGTRLIYIKNACTLNNFHKRPLIIKHQQAYILCHEIIFKRCMAGQVRRLPKSIFHSIKLDLCFFPDENLHSNILIQSEKLCLITRVSNIHPFLVRRKFPLQKFSLILFSKKRGIPQCHHSW